MAIFSFPQSNGWIPGMNWKQYAIAALSFGFLFVPSVVVARTWHVSSSSGADAHDGLSSETAFSSIQQAVLSAASGDVILVDDGVYAPFGTSNKYIRIESLNGPEKTIVDGGNVRRCATLGTIKIVDDSPLYWTDMEDGFATGEAYQGTNTFIAGFTFRNGRAENSAGGGTLGGTVSNCVYMSNCAGRGGGAAGGWIADSVIVGNSAIGNGESLETRSKSGYGGGLDYCTAINCVISNNVASMYGGGICGGTASNSIIVANSAQYVGGSQACDLYACQIIGNVASRDAGGAGGWDTTIENCWIEGNRGEYGGGCGNVKMVANSVLVGNRASLHGGGSHQATLINCTVSGNSSMYSGGGVHKGEIRNSIVWGNTAQDSNDVCLAKARFSCADNLGEEDGNMQSDPLFMDAEEHDFRLQPTSPCINAGNSHDNAWPEDFVGEMRVRSGMIDMGAYEMPGKEGIVGITTIAPPGGCRIEPIGGTVAAGGSLSFSAHGCRPFLGFYTNGNFASSNAVFTWKNITEDGVLLAKFDTSEPSTFYVDAALGDDGNTGVSPDTPFASIQKGIDTAIDGDIIRVADGTYAPINSGNKPIRIESLHGPDNTIIDGAHTARCVTVSPSRKYCPVLHDGSWNLACDTNTMLVGFTLQNGYGGSMLDGNAPFGGGAYGGLLTDCILRHNEATEGGGAYGAHLIHCNIISNITVFGGISRCMVEHSTVASSSRQGFMGTEGANACILLQCKVVSNRGDGGYGGMAKNTLFADNRGTGASCMSELVNCTIANNDRGVWVSEPTLMRNCIVWGNARASTLRDSVLYNCCTDGNGEFEGHITDDPLFVDSGTLDFHLQDGSPCIDAGQALGEEAGLDLDGAQRIVGRSIDIGCFEHQGHHEEVDETRSFREIWGEWSSEDSDGWPDVREIASWSDLARISWMARDALVRTGKRTEIPPGGTPVVLSLGSFPVDRALLPQEAAEIGMEDDHGIGTWRLHLKEVSSRGDNGWVNGHFEIRLGGLLLNDLVGNEDFTFPHYLGNEWIKAVYGESPAWLDTGERADWFAMRARDRIECFMTLVPSDRWKDYEDAVAEENATLAAALGEGIHDAMAFHDAPIGSNPAVIQTAVRWIAPGGIRLVGTADVCAPQWRYCGHIRHSGGTEVAGAPLLGQRGFFFATRGGDSDGDGIPDDIETWITGTDSMEMDSRGDGLSDWEKVYRYELDPARMDTAEDGISDAEKIQRGLDPRVALTGETLVRARRSIRYAYDKDDRLTGTWFGVGGGATTTTLSPAGNPERILERDNVPIP